MKTMLPAARDPVAPAPPRRLPLAPPRRLLLAALAAAAGSTAAAAAAGLPLGAAFLAGLAVSAALAWRLGAGLGRTAEAPAPPSAPEADPELDPEPDPGAAVTRLVDTLPTPLIVVAANGIVTHANPAARRSLPRLAVGAHHASLIRAPGFVMAVGASLVDREERALSFAANPGRERVFDARISPVPTGAAFGDGALVIQIEDRTDARRAEQLRSDFIANASHELRTPLASIIGYIETLQHHARDDPAARERFLRIMEREAGRMQRLVDDLMSLSRIELSEHVRPQEPCALTDIAAEAASALAPVARAHDVTLQVSMPGPSPVVPGDRDQLYQVFTNLIDNAIKYAGAGATVRVTPASPSRAFPSRIGVTVEDTGPGIPREHLPRLTERFYRASAGQSRNKGGTGLGLAIVKHILNRHEGKLEIVSTLGKGSAFTAWLPGSGT